MHDEGLRMMQRQQWRAITFWIVVTLLLTVPVNLALFYMTGRPFTARAVKACLGLTALLWCCNQVGRRFGRPWWFLFGAVTILLYFVHVLFFGLAEFSGRGFDDGFFLSLHAEAVTVAWRYYAKYIYIFLIGTTIVCFLLVAYAERPAMLRTGRVLVVLAISLALLVGGYRTLPEYQLATAAYRWLRPATREAPVALLDAWAHSPLLHLQMPDKSAVHAAAPRRARNLILLYVESGGVMLAPVKKYPGLAPGFQALIREHGFLPFIYTSSYVTVEGLVNTQCGTLIPFAQGDETVGSAGRLVPNMACLGDVLHDAGYRQIYLAGTSRNFAGTGQFLALHGYDEIVGKEDWRRRGVEPDPGSYAVGDARLFDLSVAELHRLKQAGKPFSLTMFTVGTHIPGFSYPGCPLYGDGRQRYLNAVHCADALIMAWIARLGRESLLENTLLVITADHQVFRSPDMMRLFGEHALDPRLPFIVIGDGLPKPMTDSGAGYDIPPTILDLLGIDTNAKFALGRSLLRKQRALDYYVSRYADFWGGKPQPLQDPAATCDSRETGAGVPVSVGIPPLDACARADLQLLLDYQAVEYARLRKSH